LICFWMNLFVLMVGSFVIHFFFVCLTLFLIDFSFWWLLLFQSFLISFCFVWFL
jgi:hypothetical protein